MISTINRFSGPNKFLSNFYRAPVGMGGRTWKTVEHAYQAAKTNNERERDLVYKAIGADDAKRIGNNRLTLREDWEVVKLSIMEDLLRQKFTHKKLREKLLATGNAILIEGNNWRDTYWGVCNGVGQNHLGLLLMKIRNEIKESDAS